MKYFQSCRIGGESAPRVLPARVLFAPKHLLAPFYFFTYPSRLLSCVCFIFTYKSARHIKTLPGDDGPWLNMYISGSRCHLPKPPLYVYAFITYSLFLFFLSGLHVNWAALMLQFSFHYCWRRSKIYFLFAITFIKKYFPYGLRRRRFCALL